MMIKLKLGQSCLTVNVSPAFLVRKHMTAILITGGLNQINRLTSVGL